MTRAAALALVVAGLPPGMARDVIRLTLKGWSADDVAAWHKMKDAERKRATYIRSADKQETGETPVGNRDGNRRNSGQGENDKPENSLPPPLPPPSSPHTPLTSSPYIPLPPGRNRRKPLPLEPMPDPAFDAFWAAYPKKKDKDKARIAFHSRNLGSILPAVLRAIEAQKAGDPQWRKDDGAFIQYPATWINAGGWHNEIQTEIAATKPVSIHTFRPDPDHWRQWLTERGDFPAAWESAGTAERHAYFAEHGPKAA